MLNIVNLGPKIDERKLLKFEENIGYKLPEEYAQFLLTYNGGVPMPPAFRLKDRSGPYTQDAVDVLYGIRPGAEGLIAVHRNFLSQGLPEDCLIIGRIVGSLPICIKLSGPDLGSIHLWNWDRQSTLELIESSFNAFLSGLHELPEFVVNPINGMIASNNVEQIRQQILMGWDVNDRPSMAMFPIEHAAVFNMIDLAVLLLENGAHLERSIELAKKRGNYEMLDILLSYSAQRELT